MGVRRASQSTRPPPSHTDPRGGHGLCPRTEVRRPMRSHRALPRCPAEGRRGPRHAPGARGTREKQPEQLRAQPGTQMRSCWPPVGQVGGDAGPVQQSRLSRCGAARGLQGAPARGGQRGQGPGSGRLSHLPHLTKTPRPGNVSNCPTALGSPGVLLVPQHRGARSLMDWPCGGQGRGSHEMQLPNDETPPRPAPGQPPRRSPLQEAPQEKSWEAGCQAVTLCRGRVSRGSGSSQPPEPGPPGPTAREPEPAASCKEPAGALGPNPGLPA